MIRLNKIITSNGGLPAAAFFLCGCLSSSVLGQQSQEITIFEENFADGTSSLTATGGASSEVVNEALEIDLGTRNSGVTFNVFSAPPVILAQLGLTPANINELFVELNLNTVGDNTEADTAASFLANDQFQISIIVRDVNGDQLSPTITSGRTTLSSEFIYNDTEPLFADNTFFSEDYPTAASVQFEVLFRENPADAENPEMGDVIGLPGNDFSIDNIRIVVDAIQGDALEVKETTILDENFEGGDAAMSEFITGASTVVDGGWLFDFEDRQTEGVNFNTVVGPTLDLVELGVDPRLVEEITYSFDMEDLTGNPSASYIGGDQRAGFVEALDQNDNVLGRYPIQDLIPRAALNQAGSFGSVTSTGTGELTDDFPTATKLRVGLFFRESPGETPAGVSDGPDFRIDNVKIVVKEVGRPEPPALPVIGAVAYDASTDVATLTWSSEEGQSYSVLYSTNLKDFSLDTVINPDPIPAAMGETTTSYEFNLPFEVENSSSLFFRVELLP